MVFGLFVCLFGGLVSGPILISLSADPLLCAVVLNSIRTTEKLGSSLPVCTSVQSYKLSTALLYRVAHLGNLLRSPISIGSKIKSYRPDGNRMVCIPELAETVSLFGWWAGICLLQTNTLAIAVIFIIMCNKYNLSII